MAWNLPACGKIVRLSELMEGSSEVTGHVRILARLQSYDCIKQQAVVCNVERNCNHQLLIDTRLVEPFHARAGSVFQFLGEIDYGENAQIILRARVVRCVDGVDVAMYNKALDAQRRFFAKRNMQT
ncbi:CST complex subunit TEN1-like [Patiria miniata]|uniref:CST complex subunit TEN1 n=1 Tax=Patiria miniata TaxID=46514 RepID=A0A914AES7_PATMI|nr:CST complex subunit TEN1-like [Patiria miniata]